MRILLDTHALLWFYLGDPKLSHQARTVIEDATIPIVSDDEALDQYSITRLW